MLLISMVLPIRNKTPAAELTSFAPLPSSLILPPEDIGILLMLLSAMSHFVVVLIVVPTPATRNNDEDDELDDDGGDDNETVATMATSVIAAVAKGHRHRTCTRARIFGGNVVDWNSSKGRCWESLRPTTQRMAKATTSW